MKAAGSILLPDSAGAILRISGKTNLFTHEPGG